MKARGLVVGLVVMGGSLVTAAPAGAVDSQRTVRPGITYFERVTTGTRPQKIFAVGVDLSVPNVGLHASADVRYSEWDVNTLTFADNTDMIAAINGDWSCIPQSTCGAAFHRPLGLAISGGGMWNPHREREDIGATWGYLGCTIGKRCDLGVARPLDHLEMIFSPLHNPTVAPLRYQNAIGANGLVLINDGVAASGCFDTGTDTPRSAACVQADGVHMWLVVVDGRGAGDGDTGMTCDETRQLLLGAPFNCFDAVMLDGGGSSTLVVEDTSGTTCRGGLCIKNSPSDGSPRTVGNHLGVFYSDTIDARCQKSNGRWCNGTVINTCEGGRFLGSGDCGAFGAGCQEDGEFAFCVHPFCPNGDGLDSASCTDATHIATCRDGQLGNGDCGAFGLVCGGPSGDARCMDARCAAGPDGSFCTTAGLVGTCTAGAYAESACAQGSTCGGAGVCTGTVVDAGNTTTVDAGGVATPDAGGRADAAVNTRVDAGGLPRADAGAPRADAGGVQGADAGGTQGVDAGGASSADESPASCGGCAGGGDVASVAWLLLVVPRRRRRAPARHS